jgi:predicted acetyltransferase
MDQIEIRAIREEEFPAVLGVAGAAFGEEYSENDANAWRSTFPFERSLAAYDDGKMVAISTAFSLELTVPGGVAIPMGGLSWIATLPTHRRRGLLRRLVEAQFADMSARGEIASGLSASEGIIYGRFGYGPATSVTSFTVERAYAAFVTPVNAATVGRFTMLDSSEAAAQLSTIYEDLRLRQSGAVSRPSGIWQAHLSDPPHEREGATHMFHVIHETVSGTPDGYVSYRVKEDWDGATARNDARVVELLAADPGVHKALWNYVLGTDLCQTVSCGRGRVDEPLRWLLADPRRFKVVDCHDFLWLRLLDVTRALAARRYAAPGRLVFEVTDVFPTPGSKRFLLSAEQTPSTGSPAAPAPDPAFPAFAECADISSAPDLALPIDMLGAAYLGGVSFASLAAAGRVRELAPGAIARADAMFATASAPYCVTEF